MNFELWPPRSGPCVKPWGWSREETYYFPIVEYRYVVDGKAYTSTRFHFARQRSTDRSEIEELLALVQNRPAVPAY